MSGIIDPASKFWGHADRIAELQKGRTSAPVSVEADLSNRCNIGCEWCHFSFTHTKGPLKNTNRRPGTIPGGDLMDPTLAVGMCKQFADAGVRSITWTGGGEPTLHPQFLEIVSQVALDGRLEQGIYTNGTLLTDLKVEVMKREFTFVYVSLDAAGAPEYKRDKRVDGFDKACAGVQRLVAAEGPATIGVGFLLTEKNWRQIPQMVKLTGELGADYCQFRPTILYKEDRPGQKDENTDWLEQCINMLSEYEDTPGVLADTARLRMYKDWKGHGYKTCNWSMMQSVVTPNGMMWTCVNRREEASSMIGNLSEDTFADIWDRHAPCKVSSKCRVMCRGQLPNLALAEILKPKQHGAFI